jgi:hypothetical protein
MSLHLSGRRRRAHRWSCIVSWRSKSTKEYTRTFEFHRPVQESAISTIEVQNPLQRGTIDDDGELATIKVRKDVSS